MDKQTSPWRKSKPASSPRTKLTPASIAKARAAARKAGRRYPNLIDNMNAARQQREAEAARAQTTRVKKAKSRPAALRQRPA